MATRPATELLYDSEATLRLVDSALEGISDLRADRSGMESQMRALIGQLVDQPRGLASLPQVLLRAYAEIMGVLESLKESRGMLERAALDKIQHTNQKLLEVTSATEVAATDIMDGVDRALGMVDELDAVEGAGGPGRAGELRQSLRDELFGMMGSLQFQDITTQQINYACSVLAEMERKLNQIAHVFDPRTFGIDPAAGSPDVAPAHPQAAFDPAATTADAEHRQALVDRIFGA